MNLLFICSQNKRRSLTAEKIFNGYNGHRAYSAGTESNSRIKVTPGLLKQADIIFCMEKSMCEESGRSIRILLTVKN